MRFEKMTTNQRSASLTPTPSAATAHEGSVMTETVFDHFRKS